MFSAGLPKLLSDHRLIFAVSLLLMLTAGFKASALVWQVVPEPQIESKIVDQRAPSAGQSQNDLSKSDRTDQIKAANLFGQVEKTVQPSPVAVVDAPESTLNYKLRGIYYSSDEALASIILEKGNNDAQYFQLGDEIDPRIYIDSIYPDHVIISRSGKHEKLVLEKPELGKNAASRAIALQPSSPQAAILKSYRRRYAKNPMALARRFKSIPVSENGQIIGYKLKALRGEKLLSRMDIQQDDVFVEVNGVGLDKPFQALDALKSLATANDVSVTILRNGNRETLNFSL